MVLKFLATAIRKQREIKGIKTKKKEDKVSLFADDMVVYISDPPKFHEKTPTADKQLKQHGWI